MDSQRRDNEFIQRLHEAARVLFAAAAATLGLMLLPTTAMAAGSQTGFAAPELAVRALIGAARADRPQQILKILGPAGRKLVYSGDAVADRLGRARFVAAYDQASSLEPQGDDRMLLVIGEKRWPFPIPLVKSGKTWRFDTPAGVEEILDRRIGRNELDAIEVCRAYVDAQRDYAAQVRHDDGLSEYAQHFMSAPGKRDGLYWPAGAGATQSPMGPLLAEARAEGYSGGKAAPYHGYFYKILTRQGEHAPDGARDYRVGGRMIGGFALVAYPARYGDSGVMSFIVNQDGVVYQRNLGPRTEAVARAMTEFDPDPGWAELPPGADSSAPQRRPE